MTVKMTLISDGGYSLGPKGSADLPAVVRVEEIRQCPDPSGALYWVNGEDLDKVFGEAGLFSGENWPFYRCEFAEGDDEQATE